MVQRTRVLKGYTISFSRMIPSGMDPHSTCFDSSKQKYPCGVREDDVLRKIPQITPPLKCLIQEKRHSKIKRRKHQKQKYSWDFFHCLLIVYLVHEVFNCGKLPRSDRYRSERDAMYKSNKIW